MNYLMGDKSILKNAFMWVVLRVKMCVFPMVHDARKVF